MAWPKRKCWSPWPLCSMKPIYHSVLKILHSAPLPHSKVHLLPATIIPKDEHSVFCFPCLSLAISTAYWSYEAQYLTSHWDAMPQDPCVSNPMNLTSKLTSCAHLLTPTHGSTAPWFLSPHLKFLTYSSIPCIEYPSYTFQQTVPFSYQVLLCNSLRSTLHSHPLYHPLSRPFSQSGHCFQFWNHTHILSWALFPQPRTIALSLLCPPPPPAANTYSSSQSQPKSTSLEAFPDYPPFICPRSTLYFSLEMKSLCSLGMDHICPPHHGFPNTQWIFCIGGAQQIFRKRINVMVSTPYQDPHQIQNYFKKDLS